MANCSLPVIRVPALKGCFPFRLGTSSYIVPADIEPNVDILAPWVDDVELVLFESHEYSNLPDEATIMRLVELANAHDLTYTVHFPLDTALGSPDELERRTSVDKCLRVYRLTRPLRPHAWIVHFHGERRGPEPATDAVTWRTRLARSVTELLASGVPAERLAVETLDYPYDLVLPVITAHGLSVCVDVGHELLNGRDPVKSVEKYGARCRVIHLHGVRDGKDHTVLGAMEMKMLHGLRHTLTATGVPSRVVTLEVFSQADFEGSMSVLEEVWT